MTVSVIGAGFALTLLLAGAVAWVLPSADLVPGRPQAALVNLLAGVLVTALYVTAYLLDAPGALGLLMTLPLLAWYAVNVAALVRACWLRVSPRQRRARALARRAAPAAEHRGTW